MTRLSVIETISTANPELTRSQQDAAAFMAKVESIPEPIRNRIGSIYERSGIDFRHSCVSDYVRPVDEFEFYPRNWRLEPEPPTSSRNTLYREQSVPLATSVAEKALDQASLPADAITHVVTVSCTGFFAPGLDIELCGRLGLSRDVERVHIGFMGCYAAFNALRTANAFCQSNPEAVVLVVCLELCTLHFQVSDTMEKAVINSLFSDGAAAAIVASRSPEEARGDLCYKQGLCMLDDDSRDHMTWDVGDQGFNMGLSRHVPEVISSMLPTYIQNLLDKTGKTRSDIDFWAIHPGGRAVVERAVGALGLEDSDVADSMEILRLHGNMSSPTILFILERILNRHRALREDGEDGYGAGAALAFGPGLTIEGCLIERA